jgi:hypothetical protein
MAASKKIQIGVGFLATIGIALAGCTPNTLDSSTIQALARRSTSTNPVNVHLMMSVDWEGANLAQDNLNTMADFRSEFPAIKLTHFVSAGYFTQENALSSDLIEAFNSVISTDDEVGLHVHAWKSLVEASGVTYRDAPQYLNSRRTFPRGDDHGHDVMLNAYTRSELVAILQQSISQFSANGIQLAPIFRAGGWIADTKVLEALADVGFTADSSAVPSEHLRAELDGEPLYAEVNRIWSNIQPSTEVYSRQLPSGRSITEYTDNFCLADYVDGDKAVDLLKTRINAAAPGSDIYVHYGFHQETAEYFSANYFQFAREVSGLDQVDGKAVKIISETSATLSN